MKRLSIFPLALLALCFAATAALSAEKLALIPSPKDFVPPAGKLVFQPGDTLVFLGDSITAQCLYTQYIEDFFYTRFPATRIHFHNAGTMGDRTGDSFERFDDDISQNDPGHGRYSTVATLSPHPSGRSTLPQK